MTPEEVIEQLESLKGNSKSFLDKNEPDSIWHKDIVALNIAINIIKKTLRECNPKKANKK